MSRSTSRKSGIGPGAVFAALLAQKQYWKMYFAMKLRRLRVPAPLVLLGGSLLVLHADPADAQRGRHRRNQHPAAIVPETAGTGPE